MGIWNSISPWSNKLRLEDEPWPFETSRAKDALKALEEVAPPREDQQARAMESYDDEAEASSCFGCTCAESLFGPPAEEKYEDYSNKPEFQWSSVQADHNTQLRDERIYKLQSLAERERPPASSSRY